MAKQIGAHNPILKTFFPARHGLSPTDGPTDPIPHRLLELDQISMAVTRWACQNLKIW